MRVVLLPLHSKQGIVNELFNRNLIFKKWTKSKEINVAIKLSDTGLRGCVAPG